MRHCSGRALKHPAYQRSLGTPLRRPWRWSAPRSCPHHRTSHPSRPCQPLFVEAACTCGLHTHTARRRTAGTGRHASSVPHSGVTVWWSARLIWVRSPCDPSRKLSTSDSKRFGGTTMTAPHIIDPAGLLGEALSQASPDLMRSLLQHVINALLSADADTVCGTQWNSLAARPGTRTRIIPSQE